MATVRATKNTRGYGLVLHTDGGEYEPVGEIRRDWYGWYGYNTEGTLVCSGHQRGVAARFVYADLAAKRLGLPAASEVDYDFS